jgi:metallophosphoesterase (TIGR00282 family)
MRILMVGDVVGKPGRNAAVDLLPKLRSVHQADFVIINGENSAGGLGITRDIAIALLERGKADVITLGNHAWAKRDSYSFLDEEPRILRPANYPAGAPGRGVATYACGSGAVGVAVFQARIFMDPPIDDPFKAADEALEEINQSTPISFVEVHGEATSEKQAFGWYLDGRASAVIGTHTHVQTADERILPGGTAYLTDVGMTGPRDSVIGMKREIVVPRFLTALPNRFEVADGPALLCGVIIDIDAQTGRAQNITRIQVLHEPHADQDRET